MLKISEITSLDASKIDLNNFDLRLKDLVLIKNLISENDSSFEKTISELQIQFPSTQLTLNDGFFLPRPYSTVNEQFDDEQEALDCYFSLADLAKSEFKFNQVLVADWFENQLQRVFSDKLRPLTYNQKSFAPFGIRVLTAEKNGLDIHCENAFLHQLMPNFRKWLQTKIDIENSISFVISLDAPEEGGELIVFDMDWNQFPLRLDTTTYEERHDLNGSLFTNRNKSNVNATGFQLQSGDAVVFRAGQLWHAVQPPKGSKNRITIGCFIAKGHDNKYYYWA